MQSQPTFRKTNSKPSFFLTLVHSSSRLFISASSLGKVDPSSVQQTVHVQTDVEKAREKRIARRPPLSEILNLHDFEAIARVVMPEKAWAYYSSAADDEITHRENHMAYHRYVFPESK